MTCDQNNARCERCAGPVHCPSCAAEVEVIPEPSPDPDVDKDGDCTVCENELDLCTCTRCEFCSLVANEENWRVCGGCMATFQRYWDAEHRPSASKRDTLDEAEWPASLPSGCDVFVAEGFWRTRVRSFLLDEKYTSSRDAVVAAWNCVTDFGDWPVDEVPRLRAKLAESKETANDWMIEATNRNASCLAMEHALGSAGVSGDADGVKQLAALRSDLERENAALKKANDDFANAISVLPGATRRDAIRTAMQMCKDWHVLRRALAEMLVQRGVRSDRIGRKAILATKWWDDNGNKQPSPDPNAVDVRLAQLVSELQRCRLTVVDFVDRVEALVDDACHGTVADPDRFEPDPLPATKPEDFEGRHAFDVPISSPHDPSLGGTELRYLKAGDACPSCGWQLHEHFSGNLACDRCDTHFQPIRNETR